MCLRGTCSGWVSGVMGFCSAAMATLLLALESSGRPGTSGFFSQTLCQLGHPLTPTHLLTLPHAGMGEQELDTEQDFSRVGRVNAMLARRLELLAEVEKMARQFGVAEDVAYTCETAGHFWLLHVLSR